MLAAILVLQDCSQTGQHAVSLGCDANDVINIDSAGSVLHK
jgi:hypothetical protein